MARIFGFARFDLEFDATALEDGSQLGRAELGGRHREVGRWVLVDDTRCRAERDLKYQKRGIGEAHMVV